MLRLGSRVVTETLYQMRGGSRISNNSVVVVGGGGAIPHSRRYATAAPHGQTFREQAVRRRRGGREGDFLLPIGKFSNLSFSSSSVFSRSYMVSAEKEENVRVKKSTGLVGLKVNPNWRKDMIALLNQTLAELERLFPENPFYKRELEKLFKYHLKVVEEETDYEKVEELLGAGQVEEIIQGIKEQLELLPKMAKWKPWEGEPNTKSVPIIMMKEPGRRVPDEDYPPVKPAKEQEQK